MTPTRSTSFVAWAREALLLEERERWVRGRSEEERRKVGSHAATARGHWRVARELFRAPEHASARLLYRQALVAYEAAMPLANAAEDPPSLRTRLDGIAAGVGIDEAARARALELAFDLDDEAIVKLPSKNRYAALRVLDRLCDVLDGRLETRSVGALRRARWARVATLVLVVASIAWAALGLVRAPKNIARGRPVTASSTHYGDPAALVNGAIEWGTFAFHSNEDDPAWVLIDLGTSSSIDEVRVFNRGDAVLDESTGTEVDLSDDTVTWKPLGLCRELFTQATPCRLFARRARARYVKVSQRYLALSEIEVYGRP